MGEAIADRSRGKKIVIVAGEASGDLHGARLMEAIRGIDPGVEFFGVGGEKMERAGMTRLYRSEAISVVGITEVLRKLGPILTALGRLKRFLRREGPDLVILIDFPDFNLRIARFAHRRGLKVLYYISPQVWAWRPGRTRRIAEWVRKMVVLFPFEVALYRAAGMDVEWVGHPLLDVVRPSLSREEALQRFGLDPGRRTVGLLPGSRIHEVDRLLPVLLAAARRLRDAIPDLQFAIPLAPGISRDRVRPALEDASLAIRVVEGAAYDVMGLSDLLITASGTATLEAAILGKPMVILYKVSPLTYCVGRLLIRVRHIGLVNLVAGKGVVPELIQKDADPDRVAEEALRILRDPALRRKMAEEMARVRESLGAPGAAERAARIVCSMLSGR